MYGGGPGSMRGDDVDWSTRVRARMVARLSPSTAHTTTALRLWTGSILTPATASRARAESVWQQSLALPCGAHVSSPSLQQAICALAVEIAASAHAAHSDQLKVVAMAKASTRAAARNLIEALIVLAAQWICQIGDVRRAESESDTITTGSPLFGIALNVATYRS
jgi:hypothetical protein